MPSPLPLPALLRWWYPANSQEQVFRGIIDATQQQPLLSFTRTAGTQLSECRILLQPGPGIETAVYIGAIEPTCARWKASLRVLPSWLTRTQPAFGCGWDRPAEPSATAAARLTC